MKTRLRTWLCLLLAAGLLFSLAACSSQPETQGTETEETVAVITIGTEGPGTIAYARSEADLNYEGGYMSAICGLQHPETWVLGAKPAGDDSSFVKWTRNGEDYSAEAVITVDLDGDTSFVAVFTAPDPET